MIMSILSLKKRRVFDVNSKQDVEVYRQFLINKTWGSTGCPFELEHPFDNVPVMIDNKLIRYFLKIKE